MRQIAFSLMVFVLTVAAGNIQWRLSAENGLFFKEPSESAVLGRLSGRVIFRHRFSTARMQIQGRLTPEWMDTPKALSSIKFSGKIDGNGRLLNGNWHAFFLLKDYYYNRSERNPIFYKISNLGISYLYLLTGGKTIDFSAEYAFRNWDTHPFNRTNLVRLSAEYAFTLPLHTTLGFTLLSSRFQIRAQNRKGSHIGWQVGPGISFRHQNRFILHYSLRYMRTFSSLLQQPQGTVFVRFMWGAFVTARFAAFVYVDYQKTNPVERTIPPEWRYTAFETESWTYLKLEYDVTKQLSLYGKGGYFKDRLPDGNNLYSGIQLLAGLQFTK